MNRHCHHCGWEWTLAVDPGRGDRCHRCFADLKVCLNCIHYNRSVAHECVERRADPVADKDTANYCEYFEFIRRKFQTPTQENSRESQARDQLKKLLGD
jgi:hypothetical protein